MKKLNAIFLLAIMLSSTLLMMASVQPVSAQTWWDTNWAYRKSFTVNPAANASTEFQINLTVYNSSGVDSANTVYLGRTVNLQTELRFVPDNQTAGCNYSYWIENATSNHVDLWLKITDDLSTTGVTVWLYYGNAGATSVSSGINTFILFDNFENGSDGSWVNPSTNPISTDQAYQGTHSRKFADAGTTFTYLTSLSLPSSYIIEWYEYRVATGDGSTSQVYTTNTFDNPHSAFRQYWGYPNVGSIAVSNVGDVYTEVSTFAAGAWVRQGLVFDPLDGGSLPYRFYSGTSLVQAWCYGFQTPYVTPNTLRFHIETAGKTMYIDNLFIRKYLATPPTVSGWSAEGTQTIPMTITDALSTTTPALGVPFTVAITTNSSGVLTNATVSLDGATFLWVNATSTFSKPADTGSLFTLNTGSCSAVQNNATSYTITFSITYSAVAQNGQKTVSVSAYDSVSSATRGDYLLFEYLVLPTETYCKNGNATGGTAGTTDYNATLLVYYYPFDSNIYTEGVANVKPAMLGGNLYWVLNPTITSAIRVYSANSNWSIGSLLATDSHSVADFYIAEFPSIWPDLIVITGTTGSNGFIEAYNTTSNAFQNWSTTTNCNYMGQVLYMSENNKFVIDTVGGTWENTICIANVSDLFDQTKYQSVPFPITYSGSYSDWDTFADFHGRVAFLNWKDASSSGTSLESRLLIYNITDGTWLLPFNDTDTTAIQGYRLYLCVANNTLFFTCTRAVGTVSTACFYYTTDLVNFVNWYNESGINEGGTAEDHCNVMNLSGNMLMTANVGDRSLSGFYTIWDISNLSAITMVYNASGFRSHFSDNAPIQDNGRIAVGGESGTWLVSDYAVFNSLNTNGTVHLNGQEQTNFADVRLTQLGNTTYFIPYDMVSETNKTSALFLFKLSSLPDSPNNNTVTLYWGNSTVASASQSLANNTAALPPTFTSWGATSNTTYYLTVNSPIHGSINTTSGDYAYGTVVWLQAGPGGGYSFDHWTIDGTDYFTNPISITMDQDHNVSAYFLVTIYHLTVNPTTGGTINATSADYSSGTVVGLLATPGATYAFANWTIDGTNSTTNPTSVLMTADHNVSAYFDPYPSYPTLLSLSIAPTNLTQYQNITWVSQLTFANGTPIAGMPIDLDYLLGAVDTQTTNATGYATGTYNCTDAGTLAFETYFDGIVNNTGQYVLVYTYSSYVDVTSNALSTPASSYAITIGTFTVNSTSPFATSPYGGANGTYDPDYGLLTFTTGGNVTITSSTGFDTLSTVLVNGSISSGWFWNATAGGYEIDNVPINSTVTFDFYTSYEHGGGGGGGGGSNGTGSNSTLPPPIVWQNVTVVTPLGNFTFSYPVPTLPRLPAIPWYAAFGAVALVIIFALAAKKREPNPRRRLHKSIKASSPKRRSR